MRHKVAGWKLGRNTAHRRSLLRNLVTSLIIEERIETTIPKAKAMRPHVEKMITLGKRGDLSARRLAGSYLMTKEAVTKLFDTIAPRFGDRNGGYLRIVPPTKPSSSCWAASRCSTKSAKNEPRPGPSGWLRPRKPWKRLRPRRSPRAVLRPARRRKKSKSLGQDSEECSGTRTHLGAFLFVRASNPSNRTCTLASNERNLVALTKHT